jgi:hypothetical protein
MNLSSVEEFERRWEEPFLVYVVQTTSRDGSKLIYQSSDASRPSSHFRTSLFR